MSHADSQRSASSPASQHQNRRKRKAKAAPVPVVEQVPQVERPTTAVKVQRLAMGSVVLAAGIWAYWPTLVDIVHRWQVEPDYSHGFLVVPLALFFLWARRDHFPGIQAPAVGLGLSLLFLTAVIRYAGGRFYFGFIDGYSILLWLAAAAALLGGGQFLLWTLPSIGFLFFMIPLPFSIENAMSAPLQRVATKITCWVLQLLGQPAFNEGNVILLNSQQLEVAQACSGLRLFMSVVALAYVYMVLIRRSWWEKGILLAAIAPIAIVSNATRVVVTGLLFQFTTGEVAHKFAHDFAGWAMIPLAAALFGLLIWYLRALFEEEEILEMSAIVRESRGNQYA